MTPEVVIVENHHQVLPAWAQARQCSAAPLPVWTLDYHTDTMPCFRGSLPPPEDGAWREPATVAAAVSKLRHDEHFDWALRAGILSEAHIGICGENTDIIAHPEIRVYRPENYPSADIILNSPDQFRPLAEKFLESDTLRRLFPRLPLPDEAYIFDIDCDCILCEKSLYPADSALFSQLLNRAALVTLSLERDWVRLLKFPGETLTAPEIAGKLLSFLKK
ncbi:MAG: UPF0489 family protein [Lentisphaeria bacterium]|nr:UPF0489 family protein [Lentisphaeria bacterium]